MTKYTDEQIKALAALFEQISHEREEDSKDPSYPDNKSISAAINIAIKKPRLLLGNY